MKITLIRISLLLFTALPAIAQRSTERTGANTSQKQEVKDTRSEAQKAYVAPRNRGTVRSTSVTPRKITPKPVNTGTSAESKKSR